MQTPKGRAAQSEAVKASPRVARQLRANHVDTPDSSSSSSSVRMGKERSPKVSDRRMPISPVADRRRVGKNCEIENQVIRLKEELKIAKEELSRTEASKREACEDVKEMGKKMVEMQRSILKELAVEEVEESGDYQRFSDDSSELDAALGQIQLLKSRVKGTAEVEAELRVACDSTNLELKSLKGEFEDALSVIEAMKFQLIESKQSEYLTQSIMIDVLSQLEDSKTSYKTALGDDKPKDSGSFEFQEKVIVVEKDEELQKAKTIIEELKADLMDKETELQGISEENEKLELNLSARTIENSGLNDDLRKALQLNEDLRAKIHAKDGELRDINGKFEILNQRLEKTEMDTKRQSEAELECEKARGRERDAEVKLGMVMEEAERNSGKVGRLMEQLEVAQAAGSEMETELRRLKVQSDQWRKAAEAAAAMLAAGNEKNVDARMSPVRGSPYNDDLDDDDLRKRNVSVLKKFVVLWKKPR